MAPPRSTERESTTLSSSCAHHGHRTGDRPPVPDVASLGTVGAEMLGRQPSAVGAGPSGAGADHEAGLVDGDERARRDRLELVQERDGPALLGGPLEVPV